MDDRTSTDIIVAGTGPAGLIAALAFACEGFTVSLCGPDADAEDRRTTALMLPALELLGRLGVREGLAEQGAPLEVMRIVDATRRLVRSPTVIFRASEIDETEFGMNVPNAAFVATLEQKVRAEPAIAWRPSLVAEWRLLPDRAEARLSDGSEVHAKLVAAADGRMSPARQAAGISTQRQILRQSALVVNFFHSRDHAFTSTEFHTEGGPFTQVPLPGRRSSLVWVVRPDEAERLLGLDDENLSLRIEERMQSMLGRVTVEPGRQVYPLSGALPARFAKNRVALLGEAAHVFPPIGAQGLNLGIRDVADLVAVAARHRSDPGSARALDEYDSKRRPDILARTGAVTLLNNSLLTDMMPVQLARSAGLGVLGGFAPLRAFFMREGMRPGSGLRHAFSRVREQVRR
jgi:2-octaprenyl-6-methoxyphenol hydroxylase